MDIPNDSTIRRPSAVRVLGDLASGFFKALGEVALAIDSLPLEKKQPFKDFMVVLASKSGADKESTAFWTKDDKELAQLLSGAAWWVLQKDITGEVKRDLLRLGTEGKAAQIDAYLCSHFREEHMGRLREKIKAWLEVSYLNERKQIIADCLEAHSEAKYTLTVPALLPLIDGLTRHFRRAHLRPRRGKNIEGVVKVNQFAKHYKRKEHKLWGTSFERFVQRVAYARVEFGKGQPPSTFNRHGILHGEIPDYGSEANSLKSFLLLDTVAQFVRAVEQRSKSNLPSNP